MDMKQHLSLGYNSSQPKLGVAIEEEAASLLIQFSKGSVGNTAVRWV
jgi:hypothetical protein